MQRSCVEIFSLNVQSTDIAALGIITTGGLDNGKTSVINLTNARTPRVRH